MNVFKAKREAFEYWVTFVAPMTPDHFREVLNLSEDWVDHESPHVMVISVLSKWILSSPTTLFGQFDHLLILKTIALLSAIASPSRPAKPEGATGNFQDD